MWSLTSPHVKRISGSKNFRSSPQKAFYNKIDQKRKLPARVTMSARLVSQKRTFQIQHYANLRPSSCARIFLDGSPKTQRSYRLGDLGRIFFIGISHRGMPS